MALLDDFDAIRRSLLNRKSLPLLDAVLKDLISEKTRRNIITPRSTDMVFAALRQHSLASRPPISFSSISEPNIECGHSYRLGHDISECHKLQRKKKGDY